MEFHVYQKAPAAGKISPDRVFTDIQAAYDAMVLLHEKGELTQPAKILVHKGTYRLTKPLHFQAAVPISIEAWKSDNVTVSGGMLLTGWTRCKVNGRTVFRAKLPENVTELPFFYVNGKAAEPARWPKKGWLRVTDENLDGDYKPTNRRNFDFFHVGKGDFDPKWYDPQNILIRMIHLWHEENLKFWSYDAETRRITTASGMIVAPQEKNTEYYYANVKEALSEPNEFYFDRLKHEVLYIPKKPDRPFEAEIPAVGTLVRFDSGARWITMKGIRFRCGGNYLPVRGDRPDLRDPGCIREYADTAWTEAPRDWGKAFYQAEQGAVHVPGVILFDHAADCTVEECEISRCGWYGIGVISGCSRLSFRGNHIHDLGGGGVLVRGGNFDVVARDPELQVSRIVISGNHIHDCGLFYYAAVGIIIMNAWGCLLEDNHIHDLFYSGISCGWVWGSGPNMTHDIRIHHNHIHDLGKGLLSDMGGIYLLGVQPGTRVWENTVHHIVNRYYGGWGLYTDEGSSHIILERNVVYECACEGMHQHYGRENIVRYNIFAFNHKNGLAVSRNTLRDYTCPGEPHAKVMSFMNNLIITDGTPAITIAVKEIFEEQRFYSDNNIFCDLSRKKGQPFAKLLEADRSLTLQQWRKAGYDRHSLQTDPGLVNVRKYDFRLKKDSILREYGFTDIPDAVK